MKNNLRELLACFFDFDSSSEGDIVRSTIKSTRDNVKNSSRGRSNEFDFRMISSDEFKFPSGEKKIHTDGTEGKGKIASRDNELKPPPRVLAIRWWLSVANFNPILRGMGTASTKRGEKGEKEEAYFVSVRVARRDVSIGVCAYASCPRDKRTREHRIYDTERGHAYIHDTPLPVCPPYVRRSCHERVICTLVSLPTSSSV